MAVFDDGEDTAQATQSKDTRFNQLGQAVPEAPYYCPGCGLRYEYRRMCLGKAESGHQPIEVISTDELQGDTHTPAPSTA